MPPLNGVNGNELSGEFEHVSILRPILHLAIVEAREGATELFSSSKRQESMLTPGTCRNDLIYRSKPAKFISYAYFVNPLKSASHAVDHEVTQDRRHEWHEEACL